MRLNKILAGTSVAIFLTIGFACESRYFSTFAQSLQIAKTAGVAVGPQYDTTHVYVAPQDFNRFVASLIATFGGTTTKQGVFRVTPTPSSTMSQLVMTPVGTVSVFGFKTPVPYPFGLERTGYLVTDVPRAPGVEIGRPTESYRRVRIESKFGKLTALATDGQLPYPYGREMTGYEVTNLTDTLTKAKASGVDVLVPPYKTDERESAVVQFPGGYIAEIHSLIKK